MVALRLRWCSFSCCAAAVGLAAALVGCRGSGFDGQVYRGDGFAFELATIPPDWQPLETSDESLTFRDDEAGATILFQGRCGLDGDDVPLVALTNHLFLQFTEREVSEQTVVPFDGREAMHTAMTAKLDGVPMYYDAWVLKKDGCVYDMLYFAPPERAPRGLGRFRRVVGGFATVSDDAG